MYYHTPSASLQPPILLSNFLSARFRREHVFEYSYRTFSKTFSSPFSSSRVWLCYVSFNYHVGILWRNHSPNRFSICWVCPTRLRLLSEAENKRFNEWYCIIVNMSFLKYSMNTDNKTLSFESFYENSRCFCRRPCSGTHLVAHPGYDWQIPKRGQSGDGFQRESTRRSNESDDFIGKVHFGSQSWCIGTWARRITGRS